MNLTGERILLAHIPQQADDNKLLNNYEVGETPVGENGEGTGRDWESPHRRKEGRKLWWKPFIFYFF